MKRSSGKLNLFIRYGAIAICLLATSCLEDRASKTEASSQSSWFTGIETVKNLGGYPAAIKLTWNASTLPVSTYRIYSLQYNSDTRKNEWTVIDEVSGETTSYVNSDLVAGQIYSYMVHAVDTTGAEDTNTKQMSTVAFDGIATARATGKTTATVTLNTATGSFDQVRVYATPSRAGGVKTLVATAVGTVDTIQITGLHSGTKYRFSVSAYMNYLGAEDGNDVYLEAQTDSVSFGSGALNDNSFAYRGVMSVQSFGDAPDAPVAPQVRTVRVTWPAFSGATATTKYKVVRAGEAYSVDTTTTAACTSGVVSSCVVNCSNAGSGPQTCEDTDVAAPPMVYNYVVALLKKDSVTGDEYVEELPPTHASDFYVRVHVPSSYMVLIQRDAANYEMCNMLGTPSDPRHHQRCSYAGIGATPYNSGPGKAPLTFDNGYYDFGYNLFVDRYKLACNWTRTSAACGANGCIGTNTVSGPPSSTLGNVGDVFFELNPNYGNNCYYKTSTGWMSVDQLTDPTQIAAAVTVDPGPDGQKDRPVIAGMDVPKAFNLCNAQSTDYGNKRLLRRREYVHATAFAALPGEPGAITDHVEESKMRFGVYDTTLHIGGQLPGYYRCDNGNEASRLTIPTSLADLLSPTNTRAQISYTPGPNQDVMSKGYFIGTLSTSNCVSRWGSQDPIENTIAQSSTLLADEFMRTNAMNEFPPQLSPVASDVDSGVVYDWGNFAFDGVTGPAVGTAIASGEHWDSFALNTSQATVFSRFIPTMGVALYTNSSSYPTMSQAIYSGMLGSNAFNGYNNAIHYMIENTSSPIYYMAGGISQRFSYLLHYQTGWTRTGTWCALEAE